MSFKSSFNEHKKDIFLTAAVVLACIIAVMGGEIADYAKQPFWFKFWAVAAVVSFLALVAGFLYLWAKQDKK